jgi:DNA ligase-1
MGQPLFDLSTLLDFQSWEDLEIMRNDPPHPTIEGLTIKQQYSIYQPGQPSDHWYKWLREPMRIDGVLMYAQRGRGRHSSYYSDVTMGVWTDERILVPVCKVSCGWVDEQLACVDTFVRDNTIERFGPVRSVVAEQGAGLVIEIIFDGLDVSKRRKSGLILRSARIARLRLDKNPGDANTLATLQSLRS